MAATADGTEVASADGPQDAVVPPAAPPETKDAGHCFFPFFAPGNGCIFGGVIG